MYALKRTKNSRLYLIRKIYLEKVFDASYYSASHKYYNLEPIQLPNYNYERILLALKYV